MPSGLSFFFCQKKSHSVLRRKRRFLMQNEGKCWKIWYFRNSRSVKIHYTDKGVLQQIPRELRKYSILRNFLCASRLPKFFIFVKKTTSLVGTLFFYQVQKFCSIKKLQLIEGCYQASIWTYFVQHSIAESMEIATSDWAFLLIPLCNGDQNISRSMPDSSIQFVVTFCSSKIFELGKK